MQTAYAGDLTTMTEDEEFFPFSIAGGLRRRLERHQATYGELPRVQHFDYQDLRGLSPRMRAASPAAPPFQAQAPLAPAPQFELPSALAPQYQAEPASDLFARPAATPSHAAPSYATPSYAPPPSAAPIAPEPGAGDDGFNLLVVPRDGSPTQSAAPYTPAPPAMSQPPIAPQQPENNPFAPAAFDGQAPLSFAPQYTDPQQFAPQYADPQSFASAPQPFAPAPQSFAPAAPQAFAPPAPQPAPFMPANRSVMPPSVPHSMVPPQTADNPGWKIRDRAFQVFQPEMDQAPAPHPFVPVAQPASPNTMQIHMPAWTADQSSRPELNWTTARELNPVDWTTVKATAAPAIEHEDFEIRGHRAALAGGGAAMLGIEELGGATNVRHILLNAMIYATLITALFGILTQITGHH